MALQLRQRWFLIGGALLLTLGAMYLLQEPEADSVAEATVSRHAKPGAIEQQTVVAPVTDGVLPDLSHKAISVRETPDKAADLFKSHAWYVAPPPKPVVTEAELEKLVPTAPPVPYFYMGKLENTPQGTLIFLSARNRVVTVLAGQAIDKEWRLDKEDANALHLTYIPLGLSKVQPKTAKPAAASNVGALSNDDPTLNN